MRSLTLLSLVAVSLYGCGNTTTPTKTADEVAAAAKSLAKPDPGLYEVKTVIKDFTMPGLPPAQMDMIKKRIAASSAKTRTFCLTKEDAESGFKDMLSKMSQKQNGVQCNFSKFDTSGSHVDAAMNCTGPKGMTMAMTMDGTIAPQQSDLTMTTRGGSDMMPGMGTTMTMQTTSTRIGECPA